jgi:hypothetical protein
MYYSYPCPYCGKIFYTYNQNKEQASHVLYNGIKQHLIDYKEDEKEYELDDGEKIDSDKIYAQMREAKYAPVGGYEATVDGINETSYPDSSPSISTPSPSSVSKSSTSSTGIVLLVLLLVAAVLAVIVFFPNILTNLQGILHL